MILEIMHLVSYYNCQFIGVRKVLSRYLFACEKWRQPKKAPLANGDG